MRTCYLPIHGTWARQEDGAGVDWWQSGGPFAHSMKLAKWDILRADDPYVWSGDVNGVAGALHRFVGKPPNDKGDWTCAGRALRWYLRVYAVACTRVLIAHSHGVNPAIFAAAAGERIDVLVSIGSPVRSDLSDYYARARENIGFWLHVYDSKFDRTGSFGAIGDGNFDWWWNPKSRMQIHAHQNLALPGIGHSRLFLERLDLFHGQVLPVVQHVLNNADSFASANYDAHFG